MKRLLTGLWLVLLFLPLTVQAQRIAPTWEARYLQSEVKLGDVVEIEFTATIPAGWYLYATGFDPDCGPIPASFLFEKNKTFELVGTTSSPGAKKAYDDIFECEYTKFIGKGTFRQKVRILSQTPQISGTIDGQICTIKDGQCIPVDGKFDLGPLKVTLTTGKLVPDEIKDPKDPKSGDELAGDGGGGPCCAAIDSLTAEIAAMRRVLGGPGQGGSGTCDIARPAGFADLDIHHFDSGKEVDKPSAGLDLLLFFGVAFLSGLVALLTPCMFPMIPMTISYFTHHSKTRGQAVRTGLLYGLFIVLIYTLLGTLVARVNGPGFANWLSTNWVPNVLFFVLLLVFAFSFFGWFEIVLPNRFINKIDRRSERGGLAGIFFMAFTLALVSFSCTGPIVGNVLILAFGGEWLKPIIGMMGFSLAIAIPFALFAIFPGWLSGLPKSGGWLNSVKVVLGFFELALALKFLSVADQAYHWGILDREVFLAMWIAIFFLLGLYLLGKLRLPHDSPVEVVRVPRLIMALAVFSFVVYLIPGMWGAPLKSLSGVLPPMTTQDFDLERIAREQSGGSGDLCEAPLYADKLHLPHGLSGYFDLRQAICCARQQDKPIFLDFTGHACANCRQMEAAVWSDPRVLKILQEDYIVLALYGDEKIIKLPASEQFTTTDGLEIEGLDDYNQEFLYHFFKRQGQPYYLLLGVDESAGSEKIVIEELAAPQEYDLDVERFIKFLETGKENFQALQARSK